MKKIFACLSLCYAFVSCSLSANPVNNSNKTLGKRQQNITENSKNKKVVNLKNIFIEEVNSETDLEDFFKTYDKEEIFKVAESLLLDIDHANYTQSFLINITNNADLNLDSKLKAANTLWTSNYVDFLSQQHIHKTAAISAYGEITIFLIQKKDISFYPILNWLLNTSVANYDNVFKTLCRIHYFFNASIKENNWMDEYGNNLFERTNAYLSINKIKNRNWTPLDYSNTNNFILKIKNKVNLNMLFEQYQKIAHQDWTGKECLNLLIAIANIKQSGWNDVLDTTKKLIHPNWPSNDINKLIVNISKIDINEDFNTLSAQIKTILPAEYSAEDCVNLINKIKSIQPDRRENVVTVIKSLLQPDWPCDDINKLIDHIARINIDEDLNALSAYATSMLSTKYSAKDCIHLIWAVKNIEAEKRENVINIVKSLLQADWSSENIYELIHNIDKINIDEYVNTISAHVTNILPAKYSKEDCVKLINAVGKIKSSGRENIINVVKSLLQPDWSIEELIELIGVVTDFPTDEDFNTLIDCFKKIEFEKYSLNECKRLIKEIQNIEKEYREKLIDFVKKIAEPDWNIWEYIQYIRNAKYDTNYTFLNFYLPLLEKIKKSNKFNENTKYSQEDIYLLENIKDEITQENFDLYIEITNDLLSENNLLSGSFLTTFLLISALQPETNNDIQKIKFWSKLIKSYSNPNFLSNFKKALTIKEEKLNIINEYKNEIALGECNANEKVELFSEISKINNNDDIIYLISCFNKNKNINYYGKKSLISIFIKIGIDKWKILDNNANKIVSHFSNLHPNNDISNYGNLYCDLINFFINIDEDKFENIISETNDIISQKENLHYSHICPIATFISKIKNKEIISDIWNSIKDLNPMDLKPFEKIIKYFPKDYDFYVKKYITYYKKGEGYEDQDNDWDKFICIYKFDRKKFLYFIDTLLIFPEEKHMDIANLIFSPNIGLKKILNDDGEDEDDERIYISENLLNIYQNTQEKDFFINQMEDALKSDNKQAAKYVSYFISNNYEELYLIEDNALVQLAIRVEILLNESNDPKSPYKIHGDLLKKREEHIDFYNLTSWQFFPDKNSDSIKHKIALNPTFFRKLSQNQIDFDSVPNIHPQLINIMLGTIETRIALNPILNNVIQSEGLPSFGGIKLTTLGQDDDGYLLKLLTQPKEHRIAAQFKCILHYLTTLNADATAETLSTQEWAILSTLSSILECSTGRDAGIVNIYALLPHQYKLKTLIPIDVEDQDYLDAQEIGGIKKTAPNLYPFLEDTIQDIIDPLFTAVSPLLQELCGEADIIEAVHQGLYLRNLIGDLVGSRHKIKFDMNAGLYYEQLLAYNRQEALDIFYKYADLNLKTLISITRSKINEFMDQGKNLIIYNELRTLLDNHINGSIELDEEDRPSITDEGTVNLLILIGALNENNRLF
ncbi:MAG: hypothetical protein Q8L85_09935 [Alphaproteobacteria bacterium]|nr:hypothetical protein [Alphaproteobacteria bacterium]